MNLVCLTGRITKDFVLQKVGKNQTSKVEISVAVERDYKTGEGQQDADFPRVIVWRQSADFLSSYAQKGTMIEITGRIQTGSYTGNDGKKVYTTDVVADHVKIIGGNRSNNTQNTAARENSSNVEEDIDEYADIDINDEDLPY